MGLHSCQLPGLLKKVLMGLIRPNMSKNVLKKHKKYEQIHHLKKHSSL